MEHRLSGIDPEARTADCAACGGKVRIKRKGYGRQGETRWRCTNRAREILKPRQRRRGKLVAYHHLRGPVCERCGFEPEDECQLDVHHRDGNPHNNDPENVETLCANCHRLQTKRERARTGPKLVA